tara:strand:- start:3107 stop:4537 length:1431 start_codon:yes stop_codon:yes gene_type:complete
MCSFLGAISEDKHLFEYMKDNKDTHFDKLRHRGPDIEDFNQIDSRTLIGGFVLAINDFVKQPVEKDGAWLAWNGEIYNCPKEYTNDTEYLIDFFNNGGLSHITDLDGEYAIAYCKDGLLHLITDDFFTKPLCYTLVESSHSQGNDTIIFSSYESAIREILPKAKITHALPNTHYIFDLEKYQLISKMSIYEWDFQPKYDTFELWTNAYEQSIIKRCNTDKKIFLPMSSGYDSGGICAELLNNEKEVTVYSYLGIEDGKTMDMRSKAIKEKGNDHIIVDPGENFEEDFKEFYDRVENFIAYHYDGKPYLDIYHAYSCFAHYYICRHAKNTGHTICLSGHGADEIYSDYYSPRTKGVSIVNGDYTGWRKKWPNFDMGYGRNILGMFDRAAGAYGIETRYPYLDRAAVQNFLWLEDELKNKYYKQCLHQIMTKRNFPFDDKNLKVGLRIFKGDSNNDLFSSLLDKFYSSNNISKPPFIQ